MIEKETVLIRAATHDDFATVHQFLNELEDTDFHANELEAVFRANLLNKNNIYFVADDGHGPIGFISCHLQLLLHHSGWVGEIQEFFVTGSSRGKGVGTKLINHLKMVVLDRGALHLEVTAQTARMDTHRFYEQAGFAQTHKKFVLVL